MSKTNRNRNKNEFLTGEITETVIALKYVHLIELFEDFINKLSPMKQIVRASTQKNTLETRKIKALLSLQQRGITSQNITRFIMSRAGLSSTNEIGRRVAKPMTEKLIQSQKVLNVFRKTVDIFRQMYPYLYINARSTPKDGKYRVNMTFGFRKDEIKGYRNTLFGLFHNKNIGFRAYAGYTPIKAVFTVTPRQLYITRVIFGDYETEDVTFGSTRVFGTSFNFPKLYNFGRNSGNNVLSKNDRHHALIDRALLIFEKGGTKKLTELEYNNFGYYVVPNYDDRRNFDKVIRLAEPEYKKDINMAKRLMNIDKMLRKRAGLESRKRPRTPNRPIQKKKNKVV